MTPEAVTGLFGATVLLIAYLVARDVAGSAWPRIELRRARQTEAEDRERAIALVVQRDAARAAELLQAAEDARTLADDLILHGLATDHPYLDQLVANARELEGLAAVHLGRVDAYLTPVWFRTELDRDGADGATLSAPDDGSDGEPSDPDLTAELPLCGTGSA